GIADEQRAVGDPAAVLGTRHVLLVDVVDGEVPGNSGEHVDIGLPDRLGERHAVARLDVERAHLRLAPWIALRHSRGRTSYLAANAGQRASPECARQRRTNVG